MASVFRTAMNGFTSATHTVHSATWSTYWIHEGAVTVATIKYVHI